MKRKKAAALKYDKSLSSPIVTAMGFGEFAERMIDTAIESDVPVVENEELVSTLSNVPVGENIPEELYEIVAEILAYIYSIEKNKNT